MRISLFPGVNTNFLRFKTLCGPDDQFSSPKQIRCCPPGSPLAGKLLVANGGTTVNFHQRNADLSFHSKFYYSATAMSGIDADANNIYTGVLTTLSKWQLDFSSRTTAVLGNGGIRMIDASGDPDHIYVTSNNATDGHGIRKVRKSDMTVVASLLATGSGDGQFNNPLGVKYYNGYVYVADYSNKRIVKLDASNLSFVANFMAASLVWCQDLDTDGTNWYISESGTLYKRAMDFSAVSNIACVSYSLCIIPDQGDGNGATLAIVDSTNSHLARYKCSDLSQVGSDVGSAGTGADSLCDPQVTGPTGIWYDSEGGSYAVASAANISKNGFAGDFFRATPNMLIYRPTGVLAAITAIDFSSDNILGEIVNLYRCRSLASVKLQSNPYIALNFGCLPSCVTTLWAYACSASVFGSIKHMVGLSSLNVRENGYSQSQVDQLIDEIWQLRETHAVCTININGSNAAPSGTYQTAETPSTGKEKVYDLINNYGYDITYTA